MQETKESFDNFKLRFWYQEKQLDSKTKFRI